MKAFAFLDLVRRLEFSVFTVEDAVKLLDKPKPYVVLYLHRLEKQGLVRRVERGKYFLRDASSFVVASNLAFPSYISLWMAFHLHQLTTQLPRIIQVICSKQKKRVILDDYEVEFVKLDPKRVFGYSKERSWPGQIYLADKEKAVVDSLYFLGKGPDLDDVRRALKECDVKKLEQYALAMGSKALVRRLGYLMEREGLQSPQSFVKAYKKQLLLDPGLPAKGEKNKKWKLTINYEFDEHDN